MTSFSGISFFLSRILLFVLTEIVNTQDNFPAVSSVKTISDSRQPLFASWSSCDVTIMSRICYTNICCSPVTVVCHSNETLHSPFVTLIFELKTSTERMNWFTDVTASKSIGRVYLEDEVSKLDCHLLSCNDVHVNVTSFCLHIEEDSHSVSNKLVTQSYTVVSFALHAFLVPSNAFASVLSLCYSFGVCISSWWSAHTVQNNCRARTETKLSTGMTGHEFCEQPFKTFLPKFLCKRVSSTYHVSCMLCFADDDPTSQSAFLSFLNWLLLEKLLLPFLLSKRAEIFRDR